MTTQTATFRPAPNVLFNKQGTAALLVAVFVALVFAVLLKEDFQLGNIGGRQIAIALALYGAIAAGMLAMASHMKRVWAATRLTISEAGLNLKSAQAQAAMMPNTVMIPPEAGLLRRDIAWSDITNVHKWIYKTGEITQIRISAASGRPIVLVGYDNMAGLEKLIDANLPATAEVTRTRQSIKWTSPWTRTAIVAVALALGLLTAVAKQQASIDQMAEIMFGLTGIAISAAIIIFGLVSRINPAFRKLEVVFGILGIIGGLAKVAFALTA